MEGAKTGTGAPAPPKLHILLHHVGDVVAADDLLNIFLRDQCGHLLGQALIAIVSLLLFSSHFFLSDKL